MKKKLKVPHPKIVILLSCVFILGTAAIAIAYSLSSSSEESTTPPVASEPIPIATDNKPTENQDAPIDTNAVSEAVTSNSTIRQSDSGNPNPPSSTSRPNLPPVCTTKTTPYKYVFIKGTGPYNTGYDGSVTTCTYADGRPSYTVGEYPVVDKVVYLNVTTEYYVAAEEICRSYPSEYLQACIAVVMQQ